jgi:TonB family protein
MARSSLSPLGALIAEIRDERMRVVSGPSPADPSARSWRWPVSLALHAALIVVLVAPPLFRSDATPSASATTVSLAAAAPPLGRPAAPVPWPPVKPVRLGGDLKKPTKVKHVDPVYPATAAAAKAHGTVTLECVVSPQGRVTGVKVVSGVPLLDAAAVDAVRQWLFTPTLRHRVAVPVILTVAVQFGREDPPAHAARMASEM